MFVELKCVCLSILLMSYVGHLLQMSSSVQRVATCFCVPTSAASSTTSCVMKLMIAVIAVMKLTVDEVWHNSHNNKFKLAVSLILMGF